MRKKLKRFLIVITILFIAFFTYVELVNRNSIHMTYRQKILKAVYPAFMWFTKLTNSNSKIRSAKLDPPVSFYDLSGLLINGEKLDFNSLRGKKILIVNTASDCGYTNQYDDLQKLSESYKDKLFVLGFPANDFKEQEKGSNDAIANFCRLNYGVKFPLMQKSIVVKKAGQDPVFEWLTMASKKWME
jgi:glutathione peroxidase